MNRILALIGGGDRDQIILQTALAAARPFSAHLDFLHLRVGPAEAALNTAVEFARGPALREALRDLDHKALALSHAASSHIREFCAKSMIEISDAQTPARSRITASIREETDNAIERLTVHAADSDLIVMGRARQTQGLPQYTLERLILQGGRPMLIAASGMPRELTGTVMVCWNGSEHAVRAVTAAMPILSKAKRIVVASVTRRIAAAVSPEELARRLAGDGINAEPMLIPARRRSVPTVLASAAQDCEADLLVMGAYGQSRARELIFGSATEAFLRHADRPILLMH